jgi:NAD(P)-dependent dehydrogenase (short-subunit alcohol dehydrogenase family)
LLEEAKLQRMPKDKPLTGKVALVTGGAGGIGKAIAEKLAREGACVMLSDNRPDALEETRSKLEQTIGRDTFAAGAADVLQPARIDDLAEAACLQFGGLDIIINCAGISISRSLEETTEAEYDLLQDILAKGQFLVTQKGVAIMRRQGLGGDVVNIVSKNSLFAGPNNIAYGTAKAAQLHMSRLLAAELGKDKIRVNVVNPDAVIEDSFIWQGGWAEGRAKAYGITVEELPAFYAKRTLLNEMILPEDIANGVFAFVSGILSKSTGNTLNVDGGVAAAFVR